MILHTFLLLFASAVGALDHPHVTAEPQKTAADGEKSAYVIDKPKFKRLRRRESISTCRSFGHKGERQSFWQQCVAEAS